jgi:ZIP family zinc transporter
MFVALTLHNLPEGVGVALSSMQQGSVGTSLALAVAVHNAPEGLAIAVPVFAATHSKWAALAASIISGLSEPIGAILTLVFLYFKQVYLGAAASTAEVPSAGVDTVLSCVAGIMFTVSCVGLLPSALEHKAVPRVVLVAGFVAGFTLIAATIAVS